MKEISGKDLVGEIPYAVDAKVTSAPVSDEAWQRRLAEMRQKHPGSPPTTTVRLPSRFVPSTASAQYTAKDD
jgi:hypothetical protein